MTEFDENNIDVETNDQLEDSESYLSDVELLYVPDRQTRFESKDQIPTNAILRGYSIYPESEKYQTQPVVWATCNTTKDFSIAGDEAFVPPGVMALWVTQRPRSIMKKSENGYMQYKGAGNPDQPNFPPRVRPNTDDAGHMTLWAVSRSEANQIIHKKQLLEENNIPHTDVTRIVAIEEVPIPLDKDGAFEIRAMRDAYLTEWPYADHVRREEVQRMKRVLQERYKIADENLDDSSSIVDSYLMLEGFFQVQSEKQIPFKNSISSLIETPILLDYQAEQDHIDFDKQAKRILWIANSLGESFDIDELSNLQLPDDINLEDYKREVVILPDGVLSDGNRYIDMRSMNNVVGNLVPEKDAKTLRRQFNLQEIEPIYQLDGYRLYNDMIRSLSPESRRKLVESLDKEKDKLVQAHVNSLCAGIGLGQSLNSKDTILGEVSDYWLIGTMGTFVLSSNSDYQLKYLKAEEDSLLQSCARLDLLGGPTDDRGVELDRSMKLIFSDINVRQKIKTAAHAGRLNLPSGFSDEYREMYADTIKSLSQEAAELEARIAIGYQEYSAAIGTEKEEELKKHVHDLIDASGKYPMFVRSINISN